MNINFRSLIKPAVSVFFLLLITTVAKAEDTRVPTLVGINYETASKVIVDAGLSVGEIQFASNGCEFKLKEVIKQRPTQGTLVKTGSKVALLVNDEGQLLVPDVTGLKVDEANKILKDAGLNPINSFRYSAGSMPGYPCCEFKTEEVSTSSIIAETEPKAGAALQCEFDPTLVTTYQIKHLRSYCTLSVNARIGEICP